MARMDPQQGEPVESTGPLGGFVSPISQDSGDSLSNAAMKHEDDNNGDRDND